MLMPILLVEMLLVSLLIFSGAVAIAYLFPNNHL